MKILYLIPPSEGKNSGGNTGEEKLSFHFEKPAGIAINATEKDLKCTGRRYEEGMKLNKKLCEKTVLHLSCEERVERGTVGEDLEVRASISRYCGVMFSAIDYENMGENAQEYFNENFLILSGMYGILKPSDTIGNYKLPIETKGLKDFWGEKITEVLNESKADYIVDLLPNSYKKVIQWKKLNAKIIRIDFYCDFISPLREKIVGGLEGEEERIQDRVMAGIVKKLTHGVKKVKGEFIKNICESGYKSLEDFPGEKVQISENEYHISIIV